MWAAQLTLHPAAESEDVEGPMSASELRSARSAGSTGRGILTSPASPGEAALRSYNLRVSTLLPSLTFLGPLHASCMSL